MCKASFYTHFQFPVRIEKVPNTTALVLYDEMLARFKVYQSSTSPLVLQCHGYDSGCSTSHGNDSYTEIVFHLYRATVENNTVISVVVLDPETDLVVAEENFTVIIGRWSFAVHWKAVLYQSMCLFITF